MRTLKGQFSEALQAIGIAPMSKTRAARLLAMLYVFGGSHEDWKLNQTLGDDLKTAQNLLNIKGGELPDIEGITLLQAATDELLPEGYSGPWRAPKWAKAIAKEYGVPLVGHMGDVL